MRDEYQETKIIILRQLRLAQQIVLQYGKKISDSITKEHIATLKRRTEPNLKKLNGNNN